MEYIAIQRAQFNILSRFKSESKDLVLSSRTKTGRNEMFHPKTGVDLLRLKRFNRINRIKKIKCSSSLIHENVKRQFIILIYKNGFYFQSMMLHDSAAMIMVSCELVFLQQIFSIKKLLKTCESWYFPFITVNDGVPFVISSAWFKTRWYYSVKVLRIFVLSPLNLLWLYEW